MNKNKIDSTVIMSDIRNFTGMFERFQNEENDDFILLIEKYYSKHLLFAELVSDDKIYLNSTGDGILTIFMGKNHHREGYAFFLIMMKVLSKMFDEFSKKYDIETAFGLGIDCGTIWEVSQKQNNKIIRTYLGSVINRASRIEEKTKEFVTNVLISGNLYVRLMEDLYPELNHELEKFKNNYDTLLASSSDLKFVVMSKRLMMSYIFKMILKGIKEPLPIFRILSGMYEKEMEFWRLIIMLIGKEKAKIIQAEMKK